MALRIERILEVVERQRALLRVEARHPLEVDQAVVLLETAAAVVDRRLDHDLPVLSRHQAQRLEGDVLVALPAEALRQQPARLLPRQLHVERHAHAGRRVARGVQRRQRLRRDPGPLADDDARARPQRQRARDLQAAAGDRREGDVERLHDQPRPRRDLRRRLQRAPDLLRAGADAGQLRRVGVDRLGRLLQLLVHHRRELPVGDVEVDERDLAALAELDRPRLRARAQAPVLVPLDVRVEGDPGVAHRLVEAAGDTREERRLLRERLLGDPAALQRVVDRRGGVEAASFHVQGDRIAGDAIPHHVRLPRHGLVATALDGFQDLRFDERKERSES